MLDASGAISAARGDATLANLLGPTIVAPGSSQQFDASQSFNPNGGALNYTWTLESHSTNQRPVLTNTTSSTVNVQFPNEAGAYRLSLTVSNGNSSHTVKKDVLTGVAGTAGADIVASLTNLVSGAIITAATGTEAGLDSTSGASANNTPADPSSGGTAAGPSTPSSGGGGGGSLPVHAFGWMAAGLWLLRRQTKV